MSCICIVAFSAFLASFRAFFSLFRSSKKGIRTSIRVWKMQATHVLIRSPNSCVQEYTCWANSFSHAGYPTFASFLHLWQNAKVSPTGYFYGWVFPSNEDGLVLGIPLLRMLYEIAPKWLVVGMVYCSVCHIRTLWIFAPYWFKYPISRFSGGGKWPNWTSPNKKREYI